MGLANTSKIQGDLKSRRRAKRILWEVILYIALIGLSFIFLLPLLFMLSTSLKTPPQVFTLPLQWIPKPIKWSNYPEALTIIPFITYTKNSLIITIGSTIGTLLSCSFVAYSFARLRWPGRDILFLVLLSTMMIPFPVVMIPLFVVFSKLGWLNSYKPLIIPHFFGNPFYIFLLRQFFLTIPKELSDAARIDGCSEYNIYWKIILPLAKPALSVVAIFQSLGAWNSFLEPLIYLNDQEKYTVSIGLQLFRGAQGVEWSFLMAAASVFTLPVIIIFFLTQRYFIEGITLTGMKG